LRVERCAYPYPSRRTNWKKSSLEVQTLAVPPYAGKMILATIGWTRKSRAELRKMVRV